METRPPAELFEDVQELLALFAAVTDPIVERLTAFVDEQMGIMELTTIPTELHLKAELTRQIQALPGNAPSL